MSLKIDRNIRFLREPINFLLSNYNTAKIPNHITIMKNVPQKDSSHFGRCAMTNTKLVFKVRTKFTKDGEVHKCTKAQTIKGLCECLAYATCDEFNESLTEEMFANVMRHIQC